MTPKQIIDLTKAILDAVENDLINPADGQFKTSSVASDLQAVTDVEQAFKAAGVAVPENVDKIIKILPIVAGLLNVK